MKLVHAERVTSNLLTRVGRAVPAVTGEVALTITPEEQVAVTVLWRFARRLIDAKSSVRSLLLAIIGKDELNQEDLFDEGGGG